MSKPFTIGITGGSGSGKTFFLQGLASHFQPEQICLISQDNYYKPIEQQTTDENGIENFDLPSSIDRDTFHADILKLIGGKNVLKKEHTFNNPQAQPKMLEFKTAPIIVVEGLFVQYFEEIEKLLDLKVFVEAKDHLKLSRRIRRDKIERGYDIDAVLYQYENHAMPVYEALILPLMHKSDIVIPNNGNSTRALGVLVNFLRTKLVNA